LKTDSNGADAHLGICYICGAVVAVLLHEFGVWTLRRSTRTGRYDAEQFLVTYNDYDNDNDNNNYNHYDGDDNYNDNDDNDLCGVSSRSKLDCRY